MSGLTRKGSWLMRYFELRVPFLVSSVLVFDLVSPHTAPCVGATEYPRVAWVVFDDYVNIPDMRNLKSEDSIWPIRKTETNIDRTQRNPNRTISTSTGETTLSYASCYQATFKTQYVSGLHHYENSVLLSLIRIPLHPEEVPRTHD